MMPVAYLCGSNGNDFGKRKLAVKVFSKWVPFYVRCQMCDVRCRFMQRLTSIVALALLKKTALNEKPENIMIPRLKIFVKEIGYCTLIYMVHHTSDIVHRITSYILMKDSSLPGLCLASQAGHWLC